MRYAFIRETLADRELYGMPLSERCRILGVKAFDGKRIYGLTATPKRKDGKMPAVRMLIGEPIGRYASEAVDNKIVKMILSKTAMTCPTNASYVEQIDCLVGSQNRLRLVREATLSLVRDNRHVLLLTERVEHLGMLRDALKGADCPVFLLESGMSMKSRRAILDEMAKLPRETPFILLATGSLAGEAIRLPRTRRTRDISADLLGGPT